MILILVLLIVLLAVAGGIFIHPWILLGLLLVLVVLAADRRGV